MTRGKNGNKFNEWLSRFFAPKREIYHTPDGPQLPSSSYTTNHYQVNNCFYVSGTGNVVTRQDGQGDRNLVSQIMNLLSQHIIRGAAHDDSACDPPPRCHPETRIKLIARITAWFKGEAREEVLLWITGPAGVGKSAVVQTFAEYLAKNHALGASVFISRPNRRDNPHRIFVTIAYQLSIRIEAYRNFVTERLCVDPELPSRGMAAQFEAFIIEPFVEKMIRAGGKRWGVLLDGVDELYGEDAQCQIVQLITAFVHEHRDTPLVWIIASRPEPYISHTFTDDTNGGYWSEYIPIDSTEACEDVERFLRSSFETTRKKFRQCVPREWPSDAELLKVTAAASGLFVYAEVVMQFIRDPTESDPAARLEILLLVIDRSSAVPTKENPFVHLDALYKQILSSIPSKLWPSTKRLLSYIAFAHRFSGDSYELFLSSNFRILRGMAVFFDLAPHVVYACLLKCYSTLRIPDWKIAHKEGLTFLHASFSDFLRDPNRSGDHHVGNVEDVKRDVVLRVFNICHECSEGTESAVSSWHQYCSKWDDKTLPRAIAKFHADFFRDIFRCLITIMDYHSQRKDPVLYVQLCKVRMIKLCYSFHADDFVTFESASRWMSRMRRTQFLQRVLLKDLTFGHLNWKELSPGRAHFGKRHKFTSDGWLLNRPRSFTELTAFVSELENLQGRSPDMEVIVLGGVREERVAVFRHLVKNCSPADHNQDFKYYIIPYRE